MMRRLWIVLAVVFAMTSLATVGIGATTGTSKSKSGYKMTGKHKVATVKAMKTHKKTSMAASKARGPMFKKHFTKRTSKFARSARGPMFKKHYRTAKFARYARGPKYRCYRVKTHVRHARPARVARGPMVMPAPIVNVPQQPAPVVNVPQGPAPVVNVPAFPPTVGVSVDNCNIYVVQGDQLMIIDKNTYCLKQTVPLTGVTPSSGSSTGTGGIAVPSGTAVPAY